MSTKKIKGNLTVENDIQIDGNTNLSTATGNRALTTNVSGNLTESAVTDTELGYLSGTTSAVQTQLDAKIDDSEKGAANGVATLDGSGKLTSSQVPLELMSFKGSYNASTNTPALSDGSGDQGDTYRVTVAGSQDFGSGSITFQVGDWVYYDGSLWQKGDNIDQVTSVFGRTGAITAQSGDYASNQISYDNTTSGLTATDVKAALDEIDANVDAIVSDTYQVKISANDTTEGYLEDKITSNDLSLTISTLNDGADEDLNLVVNEANVDHDSLQNFVANEHIDHSSVNINTAADSGLTGGGDITTSRSLSVDINGTTAETSADNADEVLIYDSSAGALRKMTRANLLSGIATTSSGDISETSFSLANNQSLAADVTGLAFANGTVRSFEALVSVEIDATADLYEVFKLNGIQKGASWDMSVESTGDASLVDFTITAAGQVQYTSGNYAGFVSGDIKFRAITTSV